MNYTTAQIADFLRQFAPLRLAEEWDNVGLLIGDPQQSVQRVMTCLTVTPESVKEATDRAAHLIVSHHPFPFQAVKQITTDTVSGRMLWDLIRHGIGVYSPHTAFDSASTGINQRLATLIGLRNIGAIKKFENDSTALGSGRIGELQETDLEQLLSILKEGLGLATVAYVGQLDRACHRIAVVCGSGGSFLTAALNAGCDTLVTGEASFHTCLEAKAENVAVILLGHFASERFACEQLAAELKSAFPHLETWTSVHESDPIRRI